MTVSFCITAAAAAAATTTATATASTVTLLLPRHIVQVCNGRGHVCG